MELFSGAAWVSRCMRTSGRSVASLDINLNKDEFFSSSSWKTDPWDLLSDSGFAFLSLTSCTLYSWETSEFITIKVPYNYEGPASTHGQFGLLTSFTHILFFLKSIRNLAGENHSCMSEGLQLFGSFVRRVPSTKVSTGYNSMLQVGLSIGSNRLGL